MELSGIRSLLAACRGKYRRRDFRVNRTSRFQSLIPPQIKLLELSKRILAELYTVRCQSHNFTRRTNNIIYILCL